MIFPDKPGWSFRTFHKNRPHQQVYPVLFKVGQVAITLKKRPVPIKTAGHSDLKLPGVPRSRALLQTTRDIYRRIFLKIFYNPAGITPAPLAKMATMNGFTGHLFSCCRWSFPRSLICTSLKKRNCPRGYWLPLHRPAKAKYGYQENIKGKPQHTLYQSWNQQELPSQPAAKATPMSNVQIIRTDSGHLPQRSCNFLNMMQKMQQKILIKHADFLLIGPGKTVPLQSRQWGITPHKSLKATLQIRKKKINKCCNLSASPPYFCNTNKGYFPH